MTAAEAERVALFEAVERQTGMLPHGRRTAVTASFAELGPERATDPARLGLHDPRYFGHAAFKLAAYEPDVTTRWVHGWSLTERRARLVPEHVAYWGGHAPEGDTRFIYETSNGCGLGNSPEEAALFGLFEVAERDAFLMAWYARTPLRRIAVPVDDPMLPHLVDRLDLLGFDLMFFDSTNDLGVPAVLALALHREPDSPAPQAFFAAGAHLDPRQAMRSAAAEVAVDVLTTSAATPTSTRSPEPLSAMLDDPTLVRTMADHVAMYTLPRARPRLNFLLTHAADPINARDLWPGAPAKVSDLTALLMDLVDRLAGEGMETVVVDQTDPRVRERLGLYSAKVIVPGTLPMTFGHVYHRTRGLPRLIEVPVRLARAAVAPAYGDLPLYPHPFP